jgi:hypothetical protein
MSADGLMRDFRITHDDFFSGESKADFGTVLPYAHHFTNVFPFLLFQALSLVGIGWRDIQR